MKKIAYLISLCLIIFSACQHNPKIEVDMLFFNGKVYTANVNFEVAEAFAIKDGKIVAIGTNDEIGDAYSSENQQDLEKAVVYPGFIDAHSHLLGFGKVLNQANLLGTHSFDDLLERVTNFASTSEAEWIVGRGWNETTWESKTKPNKTKLDIFFPNIPVCLSRVDGHAVLVNQLALDLAGITEKTIIAGGKIELIGGRPSGILVDAAADKVKNLIAELTKEEIKKSFLAAQQKCLEVGLTGVTDAGLDLNELQALIELNNENKLILRVYAMMNPTQENFDYFDSIGTINTAHLVIRSVKLYADGSLGSKGALLKKPYCDDSTTTGLLQNPWPWYEKMCANLYFKGWQVNTHCIGDSSNAKILGIYAANLKGKNALRWRIEHAQVVDPIDWNYFGKYSILPSVQPTHATSDMYMAVDRLCQHRLKGAYAYQSLLKQNGILPLGTDFPVEDINPLGTFFSAVTRRNGKGEPAGGFLMAEALSFEQTIKGMTAWAAYANFYDSITGSLELNKQADFIIFNKDLKYENDASGIELKEVWIDGKKIKSAS
jgi:predicted amidohydrolase YtcJ